MKEPSQLKGEACLVAGTTLLHFNSNTLTHWNNDILHVQLWKIQYSGRVGIISICYFS